MSLTVLFGVVLPVAFLVLYGAGHYAYGRSETQEKTRG